MNVLMNNGSKLLLIHNILFQHDQSTNYGGGIRLLIILKGISTRLVLLGIRTLLDLFYLFK